MIAPTLFLSMVWARRSSRWVVVVWWAGVLLRA